ncbi:hypothetical protein [Ruminococcus sp. HUN007]|uniref:hypothetical protein n=1 Tax=Ruminococcus sp. HUN007 TaxID=1514668 RepID=UPI0005D2923A|nr:hypothetical protein [Ruminococcus sp. HUN007]
MKKLSFILLCPVLMNIVTFARTFLYDPVIMFVISFVLFFTSLYADLNSSTSRKWRMITIIDFAVTGGLMVLAWFNARVLIHISVICVMAVLCVLFLYERKNNQSFRI